MITEFDLEATVLAWFQSLKNKVISSLDISPEAELSKFISGELCVPDVDNFIEEAGCQ